MDFKELGRTSVKVPAIGIGTWEMGGGISRDTTGDKEAIRAIRKAIELGMTLIDTAEMYAAGHAEELVGEAIKPFRREQLFLVSKVAPTNLHYTDTIKAAEKSLKRLQTDWLDLYLIHHPNPEVPLKETIAAMEKLVERNLVRFIGVSNFDMSQMEAARSCLSKNEIVVNQVEYNLLARSIERDVLPYCVGHQMTLMAHMPLARGGLSRNEFLQGIGKKYEKTAAQVALNWLITREQVIAIPKAVNLDHLEQNAGAVGWELSKDDMEHISSHFR
jgi:diketogulonate reductase-like aldo/keto reductase